MKNITVGFRNKIETFKRYIYNQKKVSEAGKNASLEFVAVAKKIYKQEAIETEQYKGKLTAPDYKWLLEMMKNK